MILSADLPNLVAEHQFGLAPSGGGAAPAAAPTHRLRCLANAITTITTNIIMVGVCSSQRCINSGPSKDDLEAWLPSDDHHELQSPMDAASDDSFPLAVVAARLVSPMDCVRKPLLDFVTRMLLACRSGTRGIVCAPETVILALVLLQRTQHANIVKHQQHRADQLSRLRQLSVPNASSPVSVVSWWLSPGGAAVGSGKETVAGSTPSFVNEQAQRLSTEALGIVAGVRGSSGSNNIASPVTKSPSARTDSSSIGHLEMDATRVQGACACADCIESQVFSVNEFNMHVFMAACITLAIKLNEDLHQNNHREGGLLRHVGNVLLGGDTQSLYWAERCVLDALCFELFVSPAEYKAMLRSLAVAAGQDADAFLPMFTA